MSCSLVAWSEARTSIHMIAGRMCLSLASIATTVEAVASVEMPAMSSGATLPSWRALLTASTRLDHHTSGSCSAQPERGKFVGNSTAWKTTGVPSRSKMPTLTPPVP